MFIDQTANDERPRFLPFRESELEHKITDHTQDLIELNLNHYLEQEYGAGYESTPTFIT
jgi:hypothetical protein